MKGSGEFVWFDLWTHDLAAAEAFYTKVVGWTTQKFGDAPDAYVMWVGGAGPIGGIGKVPAEPDGSPGHPHWVSFVAVANVDETAAQAERLGGSIGTPGTDIPGVGRFAVIRDPEGAEIALLMSNQEHPGPDRMALGAVCWNELYAYDYESSWRFYSELFGWQPAGTVDMGESGPYFMFRLADSPEAMSVGAMFNGAATLKVPAHWLYYFNVEALEPAMERVRQNGGRVLEGPMDVPGGRISPCIDPQGAAFALFSQH